MTAEHTALFLRGMPTRLVREAKAAAARRGSSLAAIVSEALERSLQDDPGGEDPRDLGESIRWYEGNRSRLLRRYRGQYVAILDQAVVDHDRDFEPLAERVFTRWGVRSIFMPRVQEDERVVRVRSPRVRR